MPENWKIYKLSEAFDIIGGGTPKTKIKEYWDGDIPWLSVVDFNNDQRTVFSTEKSITELGLKKSSTKILSEGQLIISARGTVGQIAQLGRDMAFNQSCYGLSGKESILINDYGYYLLKSSITNIQSKSHGSVFDTITRNTFENIEVNIPGIEEQKSIASILSALDDKIELNLQMNKTLEEMAMALYKHWFVDFGPFQDGEFVESELGEIPKGWEVKKIEETSFEIGDGNYSSKYPTSKEFIETGIPFIRAVNMVNGSLINNDLRYISLEKHKTITKGHLKKGDVLIVTRGSIGEVARVPNYFIGANINAQLVRINGRDEVPSSYLYQTLKEPKNNNRIVANKSGTALQQLPVGALKSISLLIPPKKILHSFEKRTGMMYIMIDKNNEENQTLTQVRDTLLPKLISGEVRVKDAEKTLTEVL